MARDAPVSIVGHAAARVTCSVLMTAALAACHSLPDVANPTSDAPEGRIVSKRSTQAPPSYERVLSVWRNANDINAWIGAKFEYDTSRALRLSETQRAQSGSPPIYAPMEFFALPRGVCVDLSHFAVQTLRAIDPQAKPAYLMIEFDPVLVSGNTLRQHWLVSFEHEGQRYFFADSKRPGHIAGPYASTQAFIDDYARYRGRRIVAFREVDSYRRTTRSMAIRQTRAEQTTPDVE
jgi:hypothetical protein